MPASRMARATLDGTGENDTRWVGPVAVRAGLVYVDVRGTYVGRVSVQRSHDDGALWTNAAHPLPVGGGPWRFENAVQNAWWRVGFAEPGDHVSGTAEAEIAQ